jgi:quinol monooxygenase YgiN
MIVLVVKLTVRAGEEQRVAELFRPLQEASRKEPGCAMYIVQQQVENPRVFLVYEQYKDAAALDAHRNSPHFKQYATDQIYKVVESREADIYGLL